MRSIWIVCPTLLLACSAPPEQHGGTAAEPGKTVAIEGLYGEWLDIQDSGRTLVHERWERGTDGTPSGMGYVLSGKDTVFIEHLALLKVRDTLHYAVSIGADGGEAVLFKLVHDQDSLVFTNPDHDMPQRIVYVPEGPDAWHAIVSGTLKGTTAVDHYHFERVVKSDTTSH
ncbi:MAG: hypothetical protein JNN32_10745 [Flavobacteriales bacterium]|nr:hypothetical protein [Flavobacteriales bacterium]